jgi:glycosyltransferase involved in cell wall biosynthesis
LKIAILKGNRLNRWNLALYECAARLAPHSSPLEIRVFTAADKMIDTGSLQIPVETLPYEYEAGPLWQRYWSRLQYRRLHARAGYDFALYGLQEKLKGFDLIQSWETFNTYSRDAVRAAAKWGSKTLITVWEDRAHHMNQFPLRAAIQKEVRSLANAFLVYTDAARRALIEEGVKSERIHRVWPGVDLARYTSPPVRPTPLDEAWLGRKPFVVLFAGELAAEKGVFDLLDAAEIIFERAPLRRIYLGSGREEQALEQKIQQKGLSRCARIVPRQSYRQMPDWVRFANAVALPSRPCPGWREQLGMIAVEAMAAERPVIVSRAPGPLELLGDIPFWVEPGHPESLRETLEMLIKSPELCQERGLAGRKRAEERFDLGRNAKGLLEIYSKILSG